MKIHVDETEVNLKCNLIGQRKLQRRVLFMMDFVWGNYENKDQIQKKIKQWLMIRVQVSKKGRALEVENLKLQYFGHLV